jgi:Na+-transporting NADH:ubiquinone oxidoreductase subunit F
MFTNKIYLKNKEILNENSIKLSFGKPVNFNFIAGQYVMFGIQDGDDKLTHALTIASAPCQEDLEFIMRSTDSVFKKVVEGMESGDDVYISNAMGSLIQGDKSEAVVFLAGGIGVTPFRSMLRQAECEKSKQQFILFYSNQSEKSTVELEEFKNISLENYKAIFTFTGPVKDKQQFDVGRIDIAMLKKYIPTLLDHVYYIVGTSSFVDDMTDMLEDNGIPRSQIKIESFGNYQNA